MEWTKFPDIQRTYGGVIRTIRSCEARYQIAPDCDNIVMPSTVCRLGVRSVIWPLNELNMLSEAKPGFPRHPRVTHNDIIHKSDAKNIF